MRKTDNSMLGPQNTVWMRSVKQVRFQLSKQLRTFMQDGY